MEERSKPNHTNETNEGQRSRNKCLFWRVSLFTTQQSEYPPAGKIFLIWPRFKVLNSTIGWKFLSLYWRIDEAKWLNILGHSTTGKHPQGPSLGSVPWRLLCNRLVVLIHLALVRVMCGVDSKEEETASKSVSACRPPHACWLTVSFFFRSSH